MSVVRAPRDAIPADSSNVVPPVDWFVQAQVAATNGRLYVPLLGHLPRYPIPILRLPPGPGLSFLDIGCNWGRWSVAAARAGYLVTGIDPQPKAVEAARRVARDLGVQVEYGVACGESLPFPGESFDVVFSYSVLQHLAKDHVRRVLAEIARVLRPGGRALIQMPNHWGLRSLYNEVRRGFRLRGHFDVRYWNPGELRRTFQAAIGPSTLSVDGFFGLGIQAADLDLMPARFRAVIRSSEALRAASHRVPLLLRVADSLYVSSTKLRSDARAA